MPTSAFSLTLLGTKQTYTPYREVTNESPQVSDNPDKAKLKGDTLSHHHTCLAGVGRQHYFLSTAQERKEKKQWINQLGQSVDDKPEGKLTHCLLEGPSVAGTEVYQLTSKAVFEALSAVVRGDQVINITGFSRGGVEAILVAHELDRIQNALYFAPKPLSYKDMLTLICDSDGPPTTSLIKGPKDALKAMVATFEEENFSMLADDEKQLRLADFCDNIANLKVNLFTVDPVPGVVDENIGWHDERYLNLPGIVNSYKQWFMVNELTMGLSSIVPQKNDGCLSYEIVPMLGHHSTSCGQLAAQNKTSLKQLAAKQRRYQHLLDVNGDLKPGLTTADVQELLLYSLHDFSYKNGAEFLHERQISECQKHDVELDNLLFGYEQLNAKSKRNLKLSCYERINNNRELYELFNETSYHMFGQGDRSARFLRAGNGQFRKHDAYFSSVEASFVNKQHAALFLDDAVGLNACLSDFIAQSSDNRTLAFQKLADIISNSFTNEAEMYDMMVQSPVDTIIYSNQVKWHKNDNTAKQMVSAICKRTQGLLDDFFSKKDNSAEQVELIKLLNLLPSASDEILKQTQNTKPFFEQSPKEKIQSFYQVLRLNFKRRLALYLHKQAQAFLQKKSALEAKLLLLKQSITLNNSQGSSENIALVIKEYFDCVDECLQLSKNLSGLKDAFVATKASDASMLTITQAQMRAAFINAHVIELYKKAPLNDLLTNDQLAILQEKEALHHQLVASVPAYEGSSINFLADMDDKNQESPFKPFENEGSKNVPTTNAEDSSAPIETFNLSDFSMLVINGFIVALELSCFVLAAVCLLALSTSYLSAGIGFACVGAMIAGGFFAYAANQNTGYESVGAPVNDQTLYWSL